MSVTTFAGVAVILVIIGYMLLVIAALLWLTFGETK
jgi:hypothetical protein